MKVRLPVLLAIAALVLLAVVVATGEPGIPNAPTVFDPYPTPRYSGPPPAMTSPDRYQPVVVYSTGLLVVLTVVAALVGLALVIVLLAGLRVRRVRRTRVAGVLDGDEAGLSIGWLTEATRQAMSEMDQRQGGTPSDAVIAAWVRLEESAAVSGTEREPHQTPSEFTEAVLAAHTTDAVALQQLRAVYHRARFGEPGQVTADDAAVARQALARIALETR
jgi:Domain of unknown function (DUF4129)